jgi:hypothetical protein
MIDQIIAIAEGVTKRKSVTVAKRATAAVMTVD